MNGVPNPVHPRESFEEHIARNKRATVLVMGFMLLLLFSVIYAAGYLWGAPPTLTFPLALLLTLGYLAYTYSHSVDTVIRAAGARAPNPDVRAEKLLAYRVEEMAIAAGLPPPKVYVQDSRDINAFAAGRTPEEAVVCVTTGALEQLDQPELEGVIAHEMAHILNYDVRLQTVTVAVVGAIAMLSEILIRSLWFGAGRRGGRDRGGHPALLVVAIVLAILAPILSRLVYLLLSRKREYLADATGVRLTRNPEGLASALEKIRGDLPDDPKGSRTVASLYIANPFKRVDVQSIWSTHPPLEERVRRIRGM